MYNNYMNVFKRRFRNSEYKIQEENLKIIKPRVKSYKKIVTLQKILLMGLPRINISDHCEILNRFSHLYDATLCLSVLFE